MEKQTKTKLEGIDRNDEKNTINEERSSLYG